MSETLQSAWADTDEFSGLDIPDEFRFDSIQGAGLAGDYITAAKPSYRQRPESVFVPARI